MKVGAALLVASLWASFGHAKDHSIMEIINTERVKKMIAEQRANSSRGYSLPTPFSTNSVTDYFYTPVNASPTGSVTAVPRGKHGKKNSGNATPNLATVLSEFIRPDQLLESDKKGMLVTKKRYVRKDWCKTEPIVQTIREEGCLPKNIINRFCYGQCNSFFIPINEPGSRPRKKRPDEWESSTAFRSCGVCKPKKSAWVQVTLSCPGTESPLRRRRVHKVKQCQCMAANGF